MKVKGKQGKKKRKLGEFQLHEKNGWEPSPLPALPLTNMATERREQSSKRPP